MGNEAAQFQAVGPYESLVGGEEQACSVQFQPEKLAQVVGVGVGRGGGFGTRPRYLIV